MSENETVKIQHPRYVATRRNYSVIVGRCTVAIRCTPTHTDIAVAFCSPNDQFVRKQGRKTALERLDSSPVRLNGVDLRALPPEARWNVIECVLAREPSKPKWFPHSFESVTFA
jgi:hypothetical protein